MQKDPVWYPSGADKRPSILVAPDDDHARGRRLLSHAFSEKALAEQESLLQSYVDLLISQLGKSAAATKESQDMVQFYNWITFDIVADLLFGEPFGCLRDCKTHQYVHLLFETIGVGRMRYVFSYYPWMRPLAGLLIDRTLMTKRGEFIAWIRSQTLRRIARDTDRPDFVMHILKHNGEKGLTMSEDEMVNNASLVSISTSSLEHGAEC